MRILWVKIGGLWPPNSGGRLRSYNLIRELSRKHDVTVVTTFDSGTQRGALRRQLPDCREVIEIPHRAVKRTDRRFALMLLKSWFTRRPVDIERCHVPALAAEVSARLESGDYDLCVADFMFAVPNVPLDGRVPVVFFAHNVEHLIWRRLCEMQRKPWMRVPLEIEWRKVRRYEARACNKANLTVAVSVQDRKLLEESAPHVRICDVPTGVDVTYFTPNNGSETQAGLVFTGSMDWYPNEDAMRYFMSDILPIIRCKLPEIGVTVVGRSPSQKLREEGANAGVKITGRVEDVRPYIDKAAVYIVPIRIGGGTRLKIFEALAMAKAVVSTSVGAEGLPLLDGEHFIRADDPAAFASAVVTLVQDGEQRRALGHAGQQLVRERFSWSQVAQEFGKWCEVACG